MKQILTAFALVLCLYSFGQNDLKVQTDEIAQISDMENLLRALNYSSLSGFTEEDIEGSAYLDEQFDSGTVSLNTGIKYADIPLRYNVYNDQIEFRSRNGQMFNINNPESIRELTIGKTKFIYSDCIQNNKEKKFFAEVILEGNVSLIKHHRIKLQAAKPAETHKAAQAPRFVRIPSEFYILRNQESKYFKNEKELLLLLSDKSKELKEMIKKEKLSVHAEKDLVQIINFYNSF
jgi:hypothetical protein